MPIFRLDGDKLIIAQETNVELEQHIEIWIENSPWAVIQDELLWIGRQTSAADEERTIFPDLLGIDSEGNLIIIEFKRGRTPRDVDLLGAQLLVANYMLHGQMSFHRNRFVKLLRITLKPAKNFKKKPLMMLSERHLICLTTTKFRY